MRIAPPCPYEECTDGVSLSGSLEFRKGALHAAAIPYQVQSVPVGGTLYEMVECWEGKGSGDVEGFDWGWVRWIVGVVCWVPAIESRGKEVDKNGAFGASAHFIFARAYSQSLPPLKLIATCSSLRSVNAVPHPTETTANSPIIIQHLIDNLHRLAYRCAETVVCA
jgi:hypothetical protein